jgi:hypothetical protein
MLFHGDRAISRFRAAGFLAELQRFECDPLSHTVEFVNADRNAGGAWGLPARGSSRRPASLPGVTGRIDAVAGAVDPVRPGRVPRTSEIDLGRPWDATPMHR